MWLAIVIAAVVLFLGCAVYVEFFLRPGKAAFDRTADSSTNHMLLHQQQNSTRNQSSGI